MTDIDTPSWPSSAAVNAAMDGADAGDSGGGGDVITEPTTPVVEPTTEPTTPVTEPKPNEVVTPEGTPTPDPDTFDRAYVEKLRDEAASHRVKNKTFEDAFAGYEPEQVEYLLNITRGLRDPKQQLAAAKELKEVITSIYEARGLDPFDPDSEPKPLTQEDIDARFDQERIAREQESIVAGIRKEVADLGYTEGSLDHFALLRAAELTDDGSIVKADEKVKAWKQGIIDEFVKNQRDGKDQWLKTPPAVGKPPADTTDAPTDMEGARARADALLASMEQ